MRTSLREGDNMKTELEVTITTKVKQCKSWIEEHKKEIIVGAIAVYGTLVYCRFNDNQKRKLKNGVALNLNVLSDLLIGEDKACNIEFSNVNINNVGLKLSDAGKLGKLIMASLPGVDKNTEIKWISARNDDRRGYF